MVDIQSAAAEIRRGKKIEERKKKETTGQKYNPHLPRRAAITNLNTPTRLFHQISPVSTVRSSEAYKDSCHTID